MLTIPHCLENRLTDGVRLSAHYNNSELFPSSWLLFKTPLNPIGLFVHHRKHVRSPLLATYTFLTMGG
jgi:hypothetical protein